MDKNKENMDAQEFLKLLDADKNQDLSHLDDFDKEALEGLKMMKDHNKLHTLNTSIDEKLEELIAEEKKGNSKTGLYFLSIAASIALVIGLFFIFKKSDVQQELALTKESTGKDKNTDPVTANDLDKKAEETNSDGQVVNEDQNKKNIPAKPLLEQKQLSEPAYAYGQGMVTQTTEITLPPVPEEKVMDQEVMDEKKAYKAKADEMVDDNLVKLDALKDKDGKIAAGEDVKIAPVENSVAATSTGSATTYYSNNKTPASTGTTVAGTGDLSKTTTKSNTKGKKKENRSYNKSAEGMPPVLEESKKETAFVSTPALSNNNTTKNTNTDSGNLNSTVTTGNVRTEDESGPPAAKPVPAEFVGGKTALDAYIKKNLVIPASCPAEEIVIIRFTVDESGKVSKPKILSKTGNCPDCEKEAIRFVKAMPVWVAATANGVGVSSQKTLTLSFKK